MATATRTQYAAIAKAKIRKPGQKKPRILVYGRNKQGKTTFGASADKVLIIDPEGGAEQVPQGCDIWPVAEWGDMDAVFKFLQGGDHPYEWVCIDGLTRISNMSLRFVMRTGEERDLDRVPGLVQKQDYGKAGELMKGMLFNLDTLNLGIVYTAQQRTEDSSFNDDEDEDATDVAQRFVPDLPKGVRSSVNAIVDCIGRIYTVKVEGTVRGKEVKGWQRRLWIAPSDQYDTGYRSSTRNVPDYIKGPTVPKLVEVLHGKAESNG